MTTQWSVLGVRPRPHVFGLASALMPCCIRAPVSRTSPLARSHTYKYDASAPLLSLSASPPPLTAPQPTVAAREALHRLSASFACLSLCGLRAYCAPSSSSSSSSSFNLSRIGETHPGPIDSCERRNESIALHDLPGQHEGRHAQRPGQKRPQGMKTHQKYAQVPHTDGRLQRQYLQQPHLRHQNPKPSAFFSGCSSRYRFASFSLIRRVPFASAALARIVSIRTPHDMKQSGMTCHTQSLKVSFFSRYTQPGPGGVQSRFIWLFDGGTVASAPGGSGATAGMRPPMNCTMVIEGVTRTGISWSMVHNIR